MKSDKKSVELSEFFSIFPWPDDPDSQQGKEYFEGNLVKFMEKLLEHQWIKQLLKKKKVKILEICGGAGFGGIGLAKILSEKNIDVEILIRFKRRRTKKAQILIKKMGIKNIKTIIMDAKEIGRLKDKFDIVLLYGLSTPHFNPWGLLKLLSSVSSVLNDNGIFIVDESDRITGFS